MTNSSTAFLDPTYDKARPVAAPIDVEALPDLTPERLGIVPIGRSETIPSSWYTHSGYHSLDREYVFFRTWQYN